MSTSVTLMGNKLSISDDELSPETIKAAAEMAQKEMDALRQALGMQDTLKLAALTMIQIAGRLLELEKKGYSRTEGYSKVLEEMAKKLEDEINA
ncbi:MAG: cell division protein ZapA [Candidatus Omnitrophota bacterium]|nr:cell division protein ZapA [Candidatus Omnitrophota bacterium]MBU2528142.1 cell division protein ZapA [bacterium]MBU3929520.1 cell division protein ZapA [bacterium]MBU4123131.1 cell division protein ZapA [bacterium]